ncbi:MAG: hypothetical protein KGL48_16365 [Sphingomonadales bacterium]|nr:hypothetical protein [Sphingomonadales bacterium]MDE2568041.1 hypothetical protein [Sphingomonadales bacterium]
MTSPVAVRCLSHLSLGITGHRRTNAALRDNLAAVVASLEALFARIDAHLAGHERELGPVRMHSLLVDGVDQIAAELAVARGWELVAPLPFGAAVNLAINARPATRADAEALCRGESASDPEVEARAHAIRTVTAQARLFELADRDEVARNLFEASLADPANLEKARAFDAECSDRVELAGRVMIERTDLIVAVWDGKVNNLRGGTGHTIVAALELGTPVLVIDPAAPSVWSIYTRLEELAGPPRHDEARLWAAVDATFLQGQADECAMQRERWHERSSHLGSLYRRIETVFGGEGRPFRKLAQAYETPEQIVSGSGKDLLGATAELLADDTGVAERLNGYILPQFAWADGVSAWLSDAYRSGMCYNFFFSALAVIVGAAYLPLGLGGHKWLFATAELLLLVLILLVTFVGRRNAWHTRWFETRRVAEYLRHSPSLLLLGVSRPTGRWPRGKEKEWPEHFARHSLREAGLPRIRLDRKYLRSALERVVARHVANQRDYHTAKAKRLSAVNHGLDSVAGVCFILAILSVSAYLLLRGAAVLDLVPEDLPEHMSKLFTFLGVAFPTLGASLAGIRFFGDFQRFAAISRVTSEKLSDVHVRIELLLAGQEHAMTYRAVSALVHEIDEIVVDEIESWQAVFGAKHIALPA